MTFNVSDDMISKGWEATGEFRLPKEGEYYLVYDNSNSPRARQAVFDFDSMPALILRKQRQLKQIVFTVAGPARAIEQYEWFLGSCGITPYRNPTGHPFPRIPLVRTEIWE